MYMPLINFKKKGKTRGAIPCEERSDSTCSNKAPGSHPDAPPPMSFLPAGGMGTVSSGPPLTEVLLAAAGAPLTDCVVAAGTDAIIAGGEGVGEGVGIGGKILPDAEVESLMLV